MRLKHLGKQKPPLKQTRSHRNKATPERRHARVPDLKLNDKTSGREEAKERERETQIPLSSSPPLPLSPFPLFSPLTPAPSLPPSLLLISPILSYGHHVRQPHSFNNKICRPFILPIVSGKEGTRASRGSRSRFMKGLNNTVVVYTPHIAVCTVQFGTCKCTFCFHENWET